MRQEELLTPRSIAGIFDCAFDIYRRHFSNMVTSLAVLFLPMQAVLYFLNAVWLKPLSNYTDIHTDDSGAMLLEISGNLLIGFPQLGIPGMLSLLLLAIASAPIALAMADIYRGRQPRWRDCYRRVFPLLPRVLQGWIVVGLAFAAVLTITTFLGMALLALGSLLLVFTLKTTMPEALAIAIAIAMVLLLIVLPYLLCMGVFALCFCFTTPLILLENLPITVIPARNRQLIVKHRTRKTWATMVFLPIVFLTVQTLMLLSISSLLALFSLPPLLLFLLETTLSTLLILFLQPYLLIFINVLYFDFRIRRDGLDIRLLADAGNSPDIPMRDRQKGEYR